MSTDINATMNCEWNFPNNALWKRWVNDFSDSLPLTLVRIWKIWRYNKLYKEYVTFDHIAEHVTYLGPNTFWSILHVPAICSGYIGSYLELLYLLIPTTGTHLQKLTTANNFIILPVIGRWQFCHRSFHEDTILSSNPFKGKRIKLNTCVLNLCDSAGWGHWSSPLHSE